MENRKQGNAKQVNRVVIPSGARLTIETIADFTRLVREGLARAKSVAVLFDSDLEVDITALQALCSACKTAAAEGRAFSYDGSAPQSLTALIEASGAARHGACKQNNDGRCLCFSEVRTWEN